MFGAALALNSAWLFLGMVPPLLYLELLVIPREEAALKAEFGGTFTSYCEDTPRWGGGACPAGWLGVVLRWPPHGVRNSAIVPFLQLRLLLQWQSSLR